ncbi:MAG: hypothetical protein PSV35_05535, partial [bacterium]|nr:hypothetical protein [bacterium]
IYAINPLGDGLQLQNKRSFLNIHLTDKDEINLVNQLNAGEQFQFNAKNTKLNNTLLNLITQKVLVLEFKQLTPALLEYN